jgi:hypothetical protein
MTNPLYTITTFPTDDQAAMREFDDRYIASIGAAPPPSWSDFGDLIPTSSPMVTFPVGALGLKYSQTEGESRFKTLLHKSFDVKVQEFDTGIEAKLLDLTTQVFAYRAWQQGPARMMIAEARHRNRSIATLLEGGASATWVDGVNFFSATHLANLTDSTLGTWSNYNASTLDVVSIANIQAQCTIMQGTLDENGEKVGADPDTILVPTEKFEPLRNLLAQNFMLAGGTSTSVTSAATSNPYVGRFNVVHVPELSDANDWYLVDSKLRSSSGLAPWISMRYTVPNPSLSLRHWDESSDYFKETGNIKVSSHIWYGFSLGFPHSIRLVKGA